MFNGKIRISFKVSIEIQYCTRFFELIYCPLLSKVQYEQNASGRAALDGVQVHCNAVDERSRALAGSAWLGMSGTRYNPSSVRL